MKETGATTCCPHCLHTKARKDMASIPGKKNHSEHVRLSHHYLDLSSIAKEGLNVAETSESG